jgi:hypothetical protein
LVDRGCSSTEHDVAGKLVHGRCESSRPQCLAHRLMVARQGGSRGRRHRLHAGRRWSPLGNHTQRHRGVASCVNEAVKSSDGVAPDVAAKQTRQEFSAQSAAVAPGPVDVQAYGFCRRCSHRDPEVWCPCIDVRAASHRLWRWCVRSEAKASSALRPAERFRQGGGMPLGRR